MGLAVTVLRVVGGRMGGGPFGKKVVSMGKRVVMIVESFYRRIKQHLEPLVSGKCPCLLRYC